jgi:hypothetical protein
MVQTLKHSFWTRRGSCSSKPTILRRPLTRSNQQGAFSLAELFARGSGDTIDVRRGKVLNLQWVQIPPGIWVDPAGSYPSDGGGNKTRGGHLKKGFFKIVRASFKLRNREAKLDKSLSEVMGGRSPFTNGH